MNNKKFRKCKLCPCPSLLKRRLYVVKLCARGYVPAPCLPCLPCVLRCKASQCSALWPAAVPAAPRSAAQRLSARPVRVLNSKIKERPPNRWTPLRDVEETSMNRMPCACPAALDDINITQIEVRNSPNFSSNRFCLLPPLFGSRTNPCAACQMREGGCLLSCRPGRCAVVSF